MKGMMFNEHYGLETAVLNGSKTRTARTETIWLTLIKNDDFLNGMKVKENCYFNGGNINDNIYDNLNKIISECPSFKTRFSKGDVVAVKQSYKTLWECLEEGDAKDKFMNTYGKTKGWSNKMFVKNELMPHHIKITDVRIDKLNDITDDDCMNEGIRTGRCGNDEHGWMDAYYYDKQPFCTAKKAFASLIDKVSGNGTWEKNPAVVVYYFELIN